MRGPARARLGSLAVLLLALLLLAGSLAFFVLQRERARASLDRRLTTAVREEAAVLENYFERARSIVLLTSRNPSFAEFYAAPGSRTEKIRAGDEEILQAIDALDYLQSLYPSSIGEACFIDVGGAENARVVRGDRAPVEDLSPDESSNPFFAPTFRMDLGDVYQAEPYVSPDTDEWVISNSALVPTANASESIVHFEVTLESFRTEATSVADDVHVRVVDATTGAVVIDSARPQEIGAPLGTPDNDLFLPLTRNSAAEAIVELDGVRAAHRRLQTSPHNANRWLVVATPSATTSEGAGSLPIVMIAAALLLLLAAIGNFVRVARTLRHQEEQLVEQGERLQRAQSERGDLLRQLVDAAEEERKRLARELHDGPIQRLTSLDLKLELLRLDADKAGTDPQGQAVEDVQARLRKEIGGLRSAMTRLRPPVLDERGLSAAVSDCARTLTAPAGIACDVEAVIEGRLEPTTETIVYRVAQEALTNVVKHARAARVEVCLGADNGSVVLEVADDGVGFDPSRQSEFLQGGHFGLRVMRERVELAGGTWNVDSAPGSGTRLRAEVPR